MPLIDLDARREYVRKYNSSWAARNRDKATEYGRNWRKNNPEKQAAKNRRAAYRRKYGISVGTYDEMFAAQNGVCAICGEAPEGKRLAVDHDHATGQVRSLLCDRCNWKIGVLESDLLPALEAYLGRWSAPIMPGQQSPGGRSFG